jgi:hypothetical protein
VGDGVEVWSLSARTLLDPETEVKQARRTVSTQPSLVT